MINITPTFTYQLYELFRKHEPNEHNKLIIPIPKKEGNKITVTEEAKTNLPNTVYPYELYKYREGKPIKLNKNQESKYENNFIKKNKNNEEVHNNLVKSLIDLCRQNMNKELEDAILTELDFMEQISDPIDQKTLDYHYDLFETVQTFNDYLCVVFLHLCNILQYPNTLWYDRYLRKSIRIKPEDAMKMANKICAKMQETLEDLIGEYYKMDSIVAKIEKDTKHLGEMQLDPDKVKKIERPKRKT